MLRVVVTASRLAGIVIATATLSMACNTPPPNPVNNNNNNNNNNNGPATCDVGGTAIPRPDATDIPARKDASPIDMGCIGNPDQLAQSGAVTLQGCIAVFGLGGKAKAGIKVGVFDVDQDPSKDAPAHGEVTIAVQTDATGLDCAGADASTPACISLGCEKEGAYQISNIPVHTPLVMKVSKAGDDTVINTYTYNIVFDFGDAPAVDGVVNYEANLIYRSTYDTIPTLSGHSVDGSNDLSDGQGRGVIAGEVHDCADVIVSGATVATDQMDSGTKITYFNGSDSDPEPNLSRTSTNTDGLYVVINANTDPGKDVHTVSAGILDPACADGTKADCACVSMSTRTVRTFPDSVSIVTFRGDLPTLN